jgi:hypothetical protein
MKLINVLRPANFFPDEIVLPEEAPAVGPRCFICEATGARLMEITRQGILWRILCLLSGVPRTVSVCAAIGCAQKYIEGKR